MIWPSFAVRYCADDELLLLLSFLTISMNWLGSSISEMPL